MDSMTGLFRRLSLLIGRNKFRRELDEEMAFHRAQAEKDFADGGMPANQARVSAASQADRPRPQRTGAFSPGRSVRPDKTGLAPQSDKYD